MDDLSQGILVIDFGGQTTLLIARRFRELHVYSEVWSCEDPRLTKMETVPQCLGFVLSGGPASVGGPDSPRVADELLHSGRPVLGICYGLQLIAERFGGRVAPGKVREYGRTRIHKEGQGGEPLLADLHAHDAIVWMSHTDAMQDVPAGLSVAARSQNGEVAAIQASDPGRPIWAVQFHPEVSHTEHGTAILRRFAFDVCGASGTWSMANLAEQKVAEIRATVGGRRVICGLSGGVDSSVTAALVSRAVGDRLVCVLVDNGLLRWEEARLVQEQFAGRFDFELDVVDARERFLTVLAGVTDPEQKRKKIGHLFIDVFEEEARRHPDVAFLAQGTLYPDVIESTSVRGPSAVIKSHHNVGGLPERLPFALVEPLRSLFKDEVRELGRVLGVPEEILGRHPFPGPGLAVRVMGEVTEERLRIVRESDRIFIDLLRETELYDQVWQAFTVLLPVKTVGVMGDARTYDSVVALRAVTSADAMTADRAALPVEFLGRVADRIVNEVKGVNRVVYDLTSKPPATIEWE